MMESKIIREKISKEELIKIVKENFGNMIKVDVDVEREIVSAGGEWHSEGDELLNMDGSSREHVWGINFYPYNSSDKRIEYPSLINVKPSFNHKHMEIKDATLKEKIHNVVGNYY